MSTMLLDRSHTCGELRKENDGEKVILMGWVDRQRDHGGIIFIDLRDRYGITQVVFNPSAKNVYATGKTLRGEFVIAVKGFVEKRPDDMLNDSLATGHIEVVAEEVEILNVAKTPPFEIADNVDVSEEIRLKYRYLDMRRTAMQRNLILRHRMAQITRQFFDENSFIEIETPMLMRSTPEGARDYLVPSRVHHGKFYALPQSPQTYKQLLMVAGFDRYFQIVKCFRDEDLRADRQPEFTQIDVEMSFVNQEHIFRLVEELMVRYMDEILGIKLELPIQRMTYAKAMELYGSDKPDLRFGLAMVELNDLVESCDFRVFVDCVKNGGAVKGISVPGAAKYSRKQQDDLIELAKQLGAKGLVPVKVGDNDWQSNLNKFFDEDTRKQIIDRMQASNGDLLLIVADNREMTNEVLGNLRLKIAQDEGLIKEDNFALLWVTDFPLLEFDTEEERYVARHHPFTSPSDEDLHLLESAPGDVRAKAYDLVLNGTEIAGGSIRIFKKDMQQKMFKLLNISDEEAYSKFGFLMDAFEYGAPPHGGIAFGFDRMAMLFAGRKSIRDVIAFPKTSSAISLMDGAPSPVGSKQLKELGVKLAR
ncbi:MAG: aspartate--tRNA ligase [Calditrichaeota bacterium]|nr:MAG: aspartate--tRNA ligase [Calditrichota bacterium]